MTKAEEKGLYGVMAEFEDPNSAVAAARKIYEAGYRKINAYSPYPVEELSEAIGFHKDRVSTVVFFGGLMGALGGLALQVWTSSIAYPINIGGRPLNSWPAFVPITYECMILVAALGAVIGMLAGLSFAFLLAISSRMFPGFIKTFMPVALVTQTMPLVALTPLLVLILGRGYAVTLWITISVTFFPAFVLLVQGIQRVPQSVLDLPRAYGASAWTELRMVSIPAALPYLFAATRLTVPRALLGVMIAEWLATGTGLGNLLNQSRGYLDYGMIWTVAAVSVCLSVACYYAVLFVERRTLTRLGMQTVE